MNKYTNSKIDISKHKVAGAIEEAVAAYKSSGIKRFSDVVAMVFKSLYSAFSNVGVPSTNQSLKVKHDPPRTAPRSAHYNKFIAAVKSDLLTMFSACGDLERAVNDSFNYCQAVRATFDNAVLDLQQKSSALRSLLEPRSHNNYYFIESFTSSSAVSDTAGYAYSKCIVDTANGALVLSYGSSNDVIMVDNIDDISVDVHYDRKAFKYSLPYFGRQFGVISKHAPLPDDVPIDYIEGNTWRTSSLSKLVDPDMVNTAFDVELTARVDCVGSGTGTVGPYFFLKDGGDEPVLTDASVTGRQYSFKNGKMYYMCNAYDRYFVYSKDGKYNKRTLGVSLNIRLKEPRTLNSLIVTLRNDSSRTISGRKHSVRIDGLYVKTYNHNVESEWAPVSFSDRGAGNRLVLHFNTISNIKALRINLSTDEPYRIRYTMTRWKVKGGRRYVLFGPKNTRWAYVQVLGTTLPTPAEVSKLTGYDVDSSSASTMMTLHSQCSTDESDMYRWCVSVSGVSAHEPVYEPVGQYISGRIECKGPIDQIMLYADHELNGGTIDYYVLTEERDSYRIMPYNAPIDDDSVPRVLYVNSALPGSRVAQSKYNGNDHIATPSPMHTFMIMIVMRRGSDQLSTPKVYEYKVRVIQKE